MDLPLLQWLETHTFPVEARFADPSFARKVGRDVEMCGANKKISKARMPVVLECILGEVEKMIIFTRPLSKGTMTVAILLHRVPQITHLRF